jgi:hypothetical protein
MKSSKQVGQISTALAAAQRECKEAAKGGTSHMGKYERIEDLQAQSKKAFGNNGLAFVMAPYSATLGMLGIRWRLTHVSGEWLSDAWEVAITAKTPQDIGKMLTYFRRYTLAGILPLLAPDEDIDEVQPEKPKGLPTKSAASRQELYDAVTEQVEATKETFTPEPEPEDDDNWSF